AAGKVPAGHVGMLDQEYPSLPVENKAAHAERHPARHPPVEMNQGARRPCRQNAEIVHGLVIWCHFSRLPCRDDAIRFAVLAWLPVVIGFCVGSRTGLVNAYCPFRWPWFGSRGARLQSCFDCKSIFRAVLFSEVFLCRKFVVSGRSFPALACPTPPWLLRR